MHHKNPDCGNVEIGEGNCPRCWRDSFTCDDKSHHFAENAEICDCRKLTRQMAESEAFTDSEGYEKWTDCEKHGAVKGLNCPKCEMVILNGLSTNRFDNVLWKVVFKHLTPETQAFIKSEFENAELKGGVIQALAERERILGIIEEEYKKHDEEKLCDCRATSAIDDILTRIKI